MDRFLIEYLRSGEAWVLVGSGPSIEMGYPPREKLASVAVALVKTEVSASAVSASAVKNLDSAIQNKDYPKAFQEAEAIIGAPL